MKPLNTPTHLGASCGYEVKGEFILHLLYTSTKDLTHHNTVTTQLESTETNLHSKLTSILAPKYYSLLWGQQLMGLYTSSCFFLAFSCFLYYKNNITQHKAPNSLPQALGKTEDPGVGTRDEGRTLWSHIQHKTPNSLPRTLRMTEDPGLTLGVEVGES